MWWADACLRKKSQKWWNEGRSHRDKSSIPSRASPIARCNVWNIDDGHLWQWCSKTRIKFLLGVWYKMFWPQVTLTLWVRERSRMDPKCRWNLVNQCKLVSFMYSNLHSSWARDYHFYLHSTLVLLQSRIVPSHCLANSSVNQRTSNFHEKNVLVSKQKYVVRGST